MSSCDNYRACKSTWRAENRANETRRYRSAATETLVDVKKAENPYWLVKIANIPFQSESEADFRATGRPQLLAAAGQRRPALDGIVELEGPSVYLGREIDRQIHAR